MSSESHAAIPADHAVGDHEHHPSPGVYVMIGVILFILTVIEVAVVYIEVFRSVTGLLQFTLLALMTIKFALVVLFFMHLKFDNKLFAGLFTVPLLVATAIVIALMALLGAFAVSGVDVTHVVPAVPPAAPGGTGH